MSLAPAFFITAITGLVFIVAALFMIHRPPAKINDLYGYRTRRSMASQQAWDFAQKRSGWLFLKLGIGLTGFSTIFLFLPLADEWGVVLSLAITIAACIFLIFRIENELKNQFG